MPTLDGSVVTSYSFAVEAEHHLGIASNVLRALPDDDAYPVVMDPPMPTHGTRAIAPHGRKLPQRRCPVCQASCAAGQPNNLTLCRSCQHVFQSDLCVSTTYDSHYVHRYDELPCESMSAVRWHFIQHSLGLPAGSRILDIGYGNGAFLTHVRQRGMAVYGLDVHGEDFGIPTVDYDTDETFDLVCFFDSLEHLPGFDCLFRLRTSHVVVSLPHAPPFLLQTPSRWRHYKPGEHLHYFSPRSLDVLMQRWGFAHRTAAGFPEDALRGKLQIDGVPHDNIYTAIYAKT